MINGHTHKDMEQICKNLYAEYRDRLMEVSTETINSRRDDAMNTFIRLGLPTQAVEEYKYIDVKKAFEGNYEMSIQAAQVSVKDALVTVNNEALISKYYAQCADNSDPITALNTAFTTECVCIHVGKDQHINSPLEIADVLKSATDKMEHKRILVILEESSSLTLLLHYKAADRINFLTTQVIEFFVGDNAHIDIYEIEETHSACTRFNNVYIHAGRNAVVRHNGITLFNGITRNTIRVALAGEYSEVMLNGCVMEDRNQMVDVNTLIHHKVPNCISKELYKFVVDGQAVGAFAGKVLVDEGAQKTLSEEVNQNICISTDARMYTQPMLEIYADDVKCSHGSTVGKLDETALFYMRQRGIPLDEARNLLIQAFISQVVDYIPLTTLRDRLHLMVERRLKGELDSCIGCAICK